MATNTTITITKATHLPSVAALETAPTGRQLYVWLDDGRSGMVGMSEWAGQPCDKWDTASFSHWRVGAGMSCWVKGSHISSVLCAEELEAMPYQQWRSFFASVPVS